MRNWKLLAMPSIGLVISTLLIGCSTLGASNRKSLMTMRGEVNQSIVLKMSLADAEETMKAIGFECELKMNATLRYYSSQDAISKTEKENVDFLQCIARQQNGLVHESLNVSLLVGEDQKIEGVVFTSGLTGL